MTLLIAFLLMAHMGVTNVFFYLAVLVLWITRTFLAK